MHINRRMPEFFSGIFFGLYVFYTYFCGINSIHQIIYDKQNFKKYSHLLFCGFDFMPCLCFINVGVFLYQFVW